MNEVMQRIYERIEASQRIRLFRHKDFKKVTAHRSGIFNLLFKLRNRNFPVKRTTFFAHFFTSPSRTFVRS